MRLVNTAGSLRNGLDYRLLCVLGWYTAGAQDAPRGTRTRPGRVRLLDWTTGARGLDY